MLNIIICGISGRMGKATYEASLQSDKYRIVAGVDPFPCDLPNPVYKKISECAEKADVIVDFSNHASVGDLIDYALSKRLPIVIATTGHTQEELARIKKASESIPVFRSGNMSLGINLIMELAKKAAQILGDDADIEIVEAHHNQKLDAPSGTALMIANGISSALEDKPAYVYDRTERREKRPKNEIGIHSIRAGTIVGEHSVIFGCENEVVTISHSAQSRSVFANGALKAAAFLKDKPAGLYDMSDLLELF